MMSLRGGDDYADKIAVQIEAGNTRVRLESTTLFLPDGQEIRYNAMVSHSGQTWFYKLMGDKQVVAQEKDNFTKIIQSANYANAR